MKDPSALKILQIGTIDECGGAAAVAGGLMRAYRERGCRVWHVVGRKRSNDEDVIVLPDDLRSAYRFSGYSALQARLRRLAGRHPNKGWGFISRALRLLAHPYVAMNWSRGREDFDFPGTREMLNLLGTPPDIVHCHNLHGGYFDLRALAWLSHHVPTVLTLHDMWTLTGHCAYSLDCDRWKTGCGTCPDLNLYPAIRRDATAENWKRKQNIYAKSQLCVATPSRWLMEQVEQSMLAPAIKVAHVIPNGVDLSVFRPADRQAVRAKLGLPQDAHVVLLPTGSQGSMWKDDRTARLAMNRVADQVPRSTIVFVAIGRRTIYPGADNINIRYIPHQTDPRAMAEYYQAADLYMHAARADNFPLTVLEALACGTPVVASAIGGIPEQVRSVDIDDLRSDRVESAQGKTGILVPAKDPERMADAVLALLSNAKLRVCLGENAAQDAVARFALDHQADAYLASYRTILTDWQATHS